MLKSQEMRKLAPEMDPLRIGTGWKKEDLEKPQIMVESTYGDSHPGSGHLNLLVEEVRKGVAEAGGFGARYFCTDICDGESQGTDGINYSLASREMITNMIEIHANATPFDGGVYLSSCDKGMPGNLIGLARVDIPAVVVPGGTMNAGPEMLTLEQLGMYSAKFERGEIDEEKLDRKTAAMIHQAAENCKKRFGQEDPVEMCCAVDGQEKRLVLSHKEYERLCGPLLERLRKPLQRSIADAHVRLSDIDEVVLVGGATRMPVVRDFVVKLFHKFPDVTVHPDEAVALGAAVQGAMKSRNREVKEMILTDVCAFTLGVEVVMERREGVYEPGHFCPVIERNTVIPASRTERFYTVYNNQDRIRISVYQGESRLTANNLLLGSLEIQVPKNRAGREAVDVTYTYDINSILEVEVKVLSTGQVKRQIIKGKHNTMTDQEIRARMEELSYLKTPPRDQEENRLLLLKGEQCYEESTGEARERIERCMRAFEAALDGRDRNQILETGQMLRECIAKTGL